MWTMLRRAIAAIAFSAAALPAHAEDVWMVKSSGVLGCRDRKALAVLEGAASAHEAAPAGCVELYPGERLLGQADVGAGFSGDMKVQRGDGSMVFVPSSAVVPDPGIGSVNEDRPE